MQDKHVDTKGTKTSSSPSIVPGTTDKSEPEAKHLGTAHSGIGARIKFNHLGPWILHFLLPLSLVLLLLRISSLE